MVDRGHVFIGFFVSKRVVHRLLIKVQKISDVNHIEVSKRPKKIQVRMRVMLYCIVEVMLSRPGFLDLVANLWSQRKCCSTSIR